MKLVRLPERLMPLATAHGLQPLYGDIHNHCALSYGHGTLEGALSRASLQLDFVSITGHAAWPDMPVNVPEVAHIVAFHIEGFAKLKKGWLPHYDILAQHNVDGVFSVFPGYEIHSSEHGDYTIVYADLTPAELQLADTPAALKIKLQQAMPDRALAFPHHIGYRQGARGINWDSFDAELSPFVEMFSMHGCAERSECSRGYLHSMGPTDGVSTMQSGLAQGKRFSVVANTDHHSGFPGSYGHGRTSVYATDHSREAIWSALATGRTNALTGDNTHLFCSIDSCVMGGEFSARKNTALAIEAVAGGAIDMIDVIRNGELIRRITPSLEPAPVSTSTDGSIETLLHLELGWGARGQNHHWTGSLDFSNAQVMSVEPRLRGVEVVSPLEGEDSGHALPTISVQDNRVDFSMTAAANPNNVTPAMQGLCIRLRVSPESVINAELSGKKLSIPVARLFSSALSGNLSIIDSPAYRFHALPQPEQWQWQGAFNLGPSRKGDNIYLRLQQLNGQTTWTSPMCCR